MTEDPKEKAEHAARVVLRGEVTGVGLRQAAVDRAGELGVLGWVRHGEAESEVLLHAEGSQAAVEELISFLGDDPAGSRVEPAEVDLVKPEGHEQFAIRGVSAGRFAVIAGLGSGSAGFELRFEVGEGTRAWALPRGPSMDPGVKRMAFEAAAAAGGPDADRPSWDQGDYEQGGRVPWPEAIDRGHAVFVLHGSRLSGGFALQRIRSGTPAQWLLIKRADEHARRGSDVTAEASG